MSDVAELEAQINALQAKLADLELSAVMTEEGFHGNMPVGPLGDDLGDSSGITGRAVNGAETDCATDSTKPWVRYRKSTYAFSEETVGPAVPCDPDYIYFRKANWYGGEIVIQ